MFCRLSNVFLVACAILLINVTVEARLALTDTVRCLKKCVYQYRCYPYYHPDNEVVYAVEDGVCKVFANGCMFSQYNCQRINSCLPVLEAVPKEKCVKLCPVCDIVHKQPVCATFSPQFPSEIPNVPYQTQYNTYCEADRAVCLSGIPYAFITDGYCLSLSSSDTLP